MVKINAIINEAKVYIEPGLNYGMKKIKKVISPLSSSGPLNYVAGLANKTLALMSHIKGDVVFPVLGRSIEGAREFLVLGAFLNFASTYIPVVNKDNLDENALKNSIDLSGNPYKLTEEATQKWVKRIVKQVKEVGLEKTNTEAALRAGLQKYLVTKGLGNNFSMQIANSLVIKKKDKVAIEKTYLALFFVSRFSSVYTTLEKWQVIKFTSELSAKMGKIPVLSVLAKYGLRKIALVAALTGMTLKFFHNCVKLSKTQIKVWKASPVDLVDSREARNKEFWNTCLGVSGLAGTAIPLALAVNPPLLMIYEVCDLTANLAYALKY